MGFRKHNEDELLFENPLTLIDRIRLFRAYVKLCLSGKKNTYVNTDFDPADEDIII